MTFALPERTFEVTKAGEFMRTITTFLTAAIMLGGCSGSDEGTVETDSGETVAYEIEGDGGDTSIRISGDDGEEMVINSGAGTDLDLPDGYSLYPGATVVSSTTMNQNDGQGTLVIMQSDASAKDMMAFYRNQAESAGIRIQMEMTTNGSEMIGGESEDGGTFSFNATPSDGGTTAQLVVGQGLN